MSIPKWRVFFYDGSSEITEHRPYVLPSGAIEWDALEGPPIRILSAGHWKEVFALNEDGTEYVG